MTTVETAAAIEPSDTERIARAHKSRRCNRCAQPFAALRNIRGRKLSEEHVIVVKTTVGERPVAGAQLSADRRKLSHFRALRKRPGKNRLVLLASEVPFTRHLRATQNPTRPLSLRGR